MTALHRLAVIHERNFGIPDSNDRFDPEQTLAKNTAMTELRGGFNWSTQHFNLFGKME